MKTRKSKKEVVIYQAKSGAIELRGGFWKGDGMGKPYADG